MTFQQHTTYEQSLKLKELGMEQRLIIDSPPTPIFQDEHYEENLAAYNKREALRRSGKYATPYSRQELEDYLMERYEVAMWLFDSGSTVYLNPEIYNGKLEDHAAYFDYHAKDPFTAIYDAVIWSLEQEKPTPTTDAS